MFASIERIERHTKDGRAHFEDDELIQTWVIHHLEILGEAARGISETLRAAHRTSRGRRSPHSGTSWFTTTSGSTSTTSGRPSSATYPTSRPRSSRSWRPNDRDRESRGDPPDDISGVDHPAAYDPGVRPRRRSARPPVSGRRPTQVGGRAPPSSVSPGASRGALEPSVGLLERARRCNPNTICPILEVDPPSW